MDSVWLSTDIVIARIKSLARSKIFAHLSVSYHHPFPLPFPCPFLFPCCFPVPFRPYPLLLFPLLPYSWTFLGVLICMDIGATGQICVGFKVEMHLFSIDIRHFYFLYFATCQYCTTWLVELSKFYSKFYLFSHHCFDSCFFLFFFVFCKNEPIVFFV